MEWQRNPPKIPAELGGKPVKAIYRAFSRKNLAAIQIPDSVTCIGEDAFYGNAIINLSIPGNVRYIGEEAFTENPLNKLTIAEGVVYIGSEAFSGATTLTDVTIPASVTYIGRGAFCGKNKMTLTIPATVKRFGGYPMSGYSSTYLEEGSCFILKADTQMGEKTLKAGRWTLTDKYNEEWTHSAK